MEKLKNSPSVLLEKVGVSVIEMEYLVRVFAWLCSHDTKKPSKFAKCMSASDISKALIHLGYKQKMSECKLYIWEVDENLDGYCDWKEFIKSYKRAAAMKKLENPKCLVPRRLFNMTMFLMYDSYDFSGEVTVEETLQLLFVRNGREKLDREIKALFGKDHNRNDGSECAIDYPTFCERLQDRSIKEHLEYLEFMR